MENFKRPEGAKSQASSNYKDINFQRKLRDGEPFKYRPNKNAQLDDTHLKSNRASPYVKVIPIDKRIIGRKLKSKEDSIFIELNRYNKTNNIVGGLFSVIGMLSIGWCFFSKTTPWYMILSIILCTLLVITTVIFDYIIKHRYNHLINNMDDLEFINTYDDIGSTSVDAMNEIIHFEDGKLIPVYKFIDSTRTSRIDFTAVIEHNNQRIIRTIENNIIESPQTSNDYEHNAYVETCRGNFNYLDSDAILKMHDNQLDIIQSKRDMENQKHYYELKQDLIDKNNLDSDTLNQLTDVTSLNQLKSEIDRLESENQATLESNIKEAEKLHRSVINQEG